MVSSAEPLLLDLDLLAEDEWSPVVSAADASLEGLEARLASVSAAIEEFNAATGQAGEPLGAVADGSQAASAGLDSYGASAQTAASGNDELMSTLQAVEERLAAVQVSTDELAASNSQLYETNILVANGLSDTTAALEANTAALDEETVANDSAAASTGRHSSGLLSVQTASMAGAAALAAFTAETVHMGAELEVADAKLVSFAGIGQQQIAGLNQQMLQLSANTGQGPKQIADGLYYTVSAGFAASDAMQVLTQSTQLATAAQTDSKVVTDVATSALRAYGLGADQTSHVLDVLTATTVAGKMQFEDLAGSLGRVLPVAAQSGVSLEQLGAAIATMTQKGLSADEAVTAIRGTLLNLEAPSKQTRDELAALGTTADDVRASIRDKGLLQTLSDLVAQTHGNMDALHDLVPNVRALVGVLADAGSSGKDYQAALDQVTNSQGKAQQAWETYEKTATASAERAKGQVVAAMTELGLGIVQGLAPGIDQIDKLLSLLDSVAPGGHGGISTFMSGFMQGMPLVGPLFTAGAVSANGDGLWGQIDDLRGKLTDMGPLGVAAAGGLSVLENRFHSGASTSKEYADGLSKANSEIENLSKLASEKNPFDFLSDLTQKKDDLVRQKDETLGLIDTAKANGNKAAEKVFEDESKSLGGQIDAYILRLQQERDKLQKAVGSGSTGSNNISTEAPPPGYLDAAATLMHSASTPVPPIGVDSLKTAVAEADAEILRTTTDLNKLLNAPTAAQDATNLKLMEAQRIIDGYDTAIANAVPNSQRYNDLVKQRGDYFNQVVAPLQAAQRSEGDMANAIKVVNDMYDRHRLSASEANAELDKLTTTTDQYGKTTVTVTAADSAQVQAVRDKIAAHEGEKTAVDNMAAANAVAADLNDQLLVPSIRNVGSAAQTTAGDVQAAASDMNTDLQGVGNVTPDLSGYQSSLVSQASQAGALARAAIEAAMASIAVNAAVNIRTTVSNAFTGDSGASSGGGSPGAAAPAGSGGGGGVGNVESMVAFDDLSPLGVNALLAFDASGPRPPSVPGAPKPAPIHIAPSAPSAAKGSAGAGRGSGASSGTRSAAQGIAAEHSSMQADTQSIQQELDAALAEFDALVHPDGKNALLARLTADLTSTDTESGLADAERILFRESLAKGGQAGANASADQLVNTWFQQVSKGVTDPAKLEELKAEAGRLLQALAEAMPEVAATVSESKGIDLAAGLFSDLGSPDSVKTLTRQVAAIIESGRPDADEAVRHLLFGDGTPSTKQASDAAKVAQQVRDLLIQNVDLNDPASVAHLQQQLADLQAALQAQAGRQGLTIPVSLDQPNPNASAGIPGLIPVPAASPGQSPLSPHTALRGLGGFTPGLNRGLPASEPTPAAPAEPETPAQAATRVIQQGQPKPDAQIENELAQQVADLVLQGQEFQAIQILAHVGSQEAIQRIVEKAAKIIQDSAATATQQVQALGELGVAKATAVAVTPIVSTNTSAEDKAADQQAQGLLSPGSSSNRVEQEAQTLADLVEHAPESAAQYLSRVPKADFQQVVSRAREIIKADAEQNHTSAADLAAENRNLNKAETAAAPTAATNLSPEEQAKLQSDDYALKHSAAYYNGGDRGFAPPPSISGSGTNAGLSIPVGAGGIPLYSTASQPSVYRYAADAATEAIRAADAAFKSSLDSFNAALAAAREALSAKDQQPPIVVHVLSSINGRIVSEEVAYHGGQSDQYAQLGMPQGRTGG